ncbi:MAG: pentapeptide repeat-containing protein [Thainema sp.]
MASPSLGRQQSSPPPSQQKRRPRIQRLPLSLRRLAAWTLEVSFVVVSAAVPYQIGAIANQHLTANRAPLNPLLSSTRETVAQTLAIPVADRQPTVAPLSNLFWSIAVIAPVVVAGSQLYLLGKTGRTTPKRWLGLRVVTATGDPPGISGAIMRECVGRWGLPVGLAYLIWRYSGAFPGLSILSGLSAIFLIGEELSAHFNPRKRAFHDRIAGTYVIEASRGQRSAPAIYPTSVYHPMGERSQDWPDDDGAITSIVLTPHNQPFNQGIAGWIRRHPGAALVISTSSLVGLILITLVGTQVYVQSQANWREARAQDDQLFITLVDKLAEPGQDAVQSVEERQAAILTLGTIQDQRAIPLLVDLLAQENNPTLVEAIQQALVTTGVPALEPLHRLNQSLQNDLKSLNRSQQPDAAIVVLRRQRATQQAIAKILSLYGADLTATNMRRVNLGQSTDPAAPFTLVLDQTDLGAVSFRGAQLAGASLRGARFYNSGTDGRFGTYDDQIADLSGADLKEADLTDALLQKTSLSRTSFIQAILDRANLATAQMSGTNFSSARLIQANLQQSMLNEAIFTGADLAEANLSNSELRLARMGKANAIGADFSNANLAQSDWQEADLSNADLQRANLRDANFNQTRLIDTNLSHAKLQNASFKDADLTATILVGANLDNADFAGAILAAPTTEDINGFVATPVEFEPADHIRGVDFRTVRNLDPQQIEYICAQGGIHQACASRPAEPENPPSAEADAVPADPTAN